VHYFHGLSPASRASVLGVVSALFIIQALKRYEDQSVFAFFLALVGMALSWLAFTTVYWVTVIAMIGNLAMAASDVATIETSSPRSRDSPKGPSGN
jgi:hypothetical protein